MEVSRKSHNPSVVYIINEKLIKESSKIPHLENRADVVHALIESYNLLKHNITVMEPVPASDDELCTFHSWAYIEYLKLLNKKEKNISESSNELYGIGYDCPLVENIYNFASIIAGGTLTAAKCLSRKLHTIAINWCGGWHHGRRNKAEGFCYVNDIVLSIEELRSTFEKVLYVDLDIHHGDGVENAYKFNRKVFTLSFHKYEPGFYPGTGSVDDVGSSPAKYYTTNVPLKEGISDNHYIYVFNKVFSVITDIFKADAIVVQCGADCITGDKLGGFNLTPRGIGSCVEIILKQNKPTLFLGGGGYNKANVAKCWTYLTSIITGHEISDDIPDNKYFSQFGPDFRLAVEPSYRRDYNTDDYLLDIIKKITDNVGKINQCNYTYLTY